MESPYDRDARRLLVVLFIVIVILCILVLFGGSMNNPGMVKRYMRDNVGDHVDPRTNEVNATALAEDACDHFRDYINEDEIPEEYFEWSLEVATAHEKKLAEEFASHGRGYLTEEGG